jgi:DNA-binding response OmpR family regulator
MFRILIVDDEEAVRTMLEEFLAMEGYHCTVAANAAEGRVLLDQVKFDLVLSDLNMPGESGFQFLQHVLADRPGVKAILFTGYHSAAIRNKALEMGVSDYITKPFRLVHLLSRLEAALSPS